MSLSHHTPEDALDEALAVLGRLSDGCGPQGAGVVRCVRDALSSPGVFLPDLPEAAIQAAQVVDSPRCDVLDLADTINADPVIASRVAHVANGGFFAGVEPVHTPRDAIVRMGIRETRNVVMGVVLRSLICEGPGRKEARVELWHHSLATAACAHGLLCELAFDDSVGFVAGLSHDVGRAVLYTWIHERGEDALPDEVFAPIAQALHPLIGAAVLSRWRLRGDLVEAVRRHHEVLEPGVDAPPMTLALQVADRMAHGLLDGTAGAEDAEPRTQRALEVLGLTPDRTEPLRAQSRARLDELLKFF